MKLFIGDIIQKLRKIKGLKENRVYPKDMVNTMSLFFLCSSFVYDII